MARILVIHAHPIAGSLGDHLVDTYVDAARAVGADVEPLVLRDLEFDPILRHTDQPLEPDLLRARRAIEAADHLVIAWPTWWGGPPALLKGFVDRVFLPGWAYRNTGAALPDGLLAGRSARLISTMDSPWWWYWLKHARAGHRTLRQATLHYCGITDVRETTGYAVRTWKPPAFTRFFGRVAADARADVRGLPVEQPMADAA